MMYLIPTENMESFEKKIARIRRKAERAKVDFSYKRLEPIQKETDLPGVTVECVPVMVECKIHYENWVVIAVLEHQSYGNLVHLVEGEWRPGKELKLPEKYKTAQSYCDHCNTMRARNKTVVLYNTETKEFKEAIPELFPNYERVQELLHIRFDWFSNEIMEPYYHVAVLKSLQYDDFIQCLKIKEREVLLSYIEDCLFDKGYTQCTIYFGDIAKESEFEYSEYSAVLYY